MIWLIAVALAIVLVWTFTTGRRYQRMGQEPRSVPRRAATNNMDLLKRFEGSECIYEEGAHILKVRIDEIVFSHNEIHFRLQILRAEGLSEFPDEMLNLTTTWSALSHTDTILHAHYVNWKLFLDPKLINDVTFRARQGEAPKSLQRSLLEHRMQHV